MYKCSYSVANNSAHACQAPCHMTCAYVKGRYLTQGPELVLFISAGTAATTVAHWLAQALVRHCRQQQGCFLGIHSVMVRAIRPHGGFWRVADLKMGRQLCPDTFKCGHVGSHQSDPVVASKSYCKSLARLMWMFHSCVCICVCVCVCVYRLCSGWLLLLPGGHVALPELLHALLVLWLSWCAPSTHAGV